ncbi:MAG: bacillithiol biosynthesis cysteine-adding enzyme BshC [Bryobacteraceae bacterium]
MASACLRHTELPGTSKLFADYLYRFDRVAPFYRYDPADPESYRSAASALVYPEERRRALIEALAAQGNDPAALEALAQPDCVAVVTGQQVGLFSGPCYTIYKALTAVRLAARLRDSGIPAAPVFWLATEDHDFDEINHAWTLSGENDAVRHEVANPGTSSTRPVGPIAIPKYPIEELADALRGLPFAEEVLALAGEAYRDGATLGAAFRALMERLLPGRGLIYVDPLEMPIRRLAAPILQQAALQAPALMDRVIARNAELAEAGYHAQVHVEPKTSPFFLLEGGERVHLLRDGGTFDGMDAEGLAARAEHLSPNAILRPVMQDYLLPTAALIGGPAEIAYLAQSQVLYEGLGRPAPVFVSRAGFTLLDERAAKSMERYRLAVSDFFEGPEPLRAKVAARITPPELETSLGATRAATADAVDRLHAALSSFDPTLGEALAKSRAKMLYQLDKIRAKTEREALRRNARADAEMHALTALLYQERHLQERFYTILPFLARHGFDLIERVEQHVRLECPDHIVLTASS